MFRSIRHRLALFTYSWHAVGPAAMLRNSLRWTIDAEARSVDSGFDARHGTDTNADLTPDEAGIPEARRAAATMYLPTMDEDLDAMLEALPWPVEQREQASFVDLGSGKGRVVLLAAMRRFREVVGVELSPVLHQTAASNVARVGASGALASHVRLVHGDATGFDVPAGPVIVYLYHPFRQELAAEVIDALVTSVARAPRPAAILYCHPTLQARYDDQVFAGRGVFALEREGARHTRRFSLGWSVWTNHTWLARESASGARAVAAAAVGDA